MNTFIKGIEYFLPEKRESGADLKIDNPDWIVDDMKRKQELLLEGYRLIIKRQQTLQKRLVKN